MGVKTRLLQEALDQLLSPLVRDEVIHQAGWDDDKDGPTISTMGLRQWVDTMLFPRLVDRATLAAADELRRQIRELFAKTEPPPAPPGKEKPSMESGICRKRPPVQGPPTIVPAASGASVLLWSPRPETARWLHAFMGKSVQLVVVTDAEEFLSTLRVLGPRISMVLMDRRDGTLGELRDVSPEDLDGHRVVMWGPRPMNNPSYKRVLTRAQRSIGCGPEADVSDVAALCATVLGVADRCLRTDKIPLDPTG